MDYLQLALDLYRLTKDPLALDAIRALESPSTPENVRNSVRNYLDAQHEAALTLFGNSDKYPSHGHYRPQTTDIP